MISGFNTDVEFDGVVYHVQTEDKGLSTRKIISLVYDRGTILASKRATYDDLASTNFDEQVLAERVQRQHKLMCAAIKAGRIEDLKKMTAKAGHDPDVEAAVPAVSIPVLSDQAVSVIQPGTTAVIHAQEVLTVRQVDVVPEHFGAVEIIEEGPLIEDVSIIEDPVVLSPDAVAVVSELSGQERTSNSKLGIELLGDFAFKGGDRLTVNIMVCRGTERKVVADAQIMIKALGSSFRPVIFHAKSDRNGLAKVHLQLPHFQAGRAALLVRAMDAGEEIEVRRVVTPG